MLRILSLLLIFLANPISTPHAAPLSDTDWKECQSVDDSVRYAGCSKIIDTQASGNKKRLADAYDGRCWALHATGRYNEAVKDCEKSITLNPKSGYVFHNLGTAYLGLKDFGRAISAFSQALSLNPKLSRSLVKRGHAYAAIGKIDDARKDYRSVLQLSPNNAEAAGSLAALPSAQPDNPARLTSDPSPPAPKNSDELKWDYVSVTAPQRAAADRRALLIANDDYKYIGKLNGPRKDVEVTSSLLKQLGFEVSILLNPGKPEISKAIQESSAGTAGGGIFMLYYSGHAAALNGENTMLLTAFDPKRGLDADNSVPLKTLMGELAETRSEKILIAFDACRNAVKVATEQIASTQQSATEIRAVRGLQLSAAETQTLRRKEYSILFSTSDGEFALDTGADGLSPFTSAFNTALKSESSFIPAMVLTKRITEDTTRQVQSPTIEIKWNSDLAYGKADRYSSSAQYELDLALAPRDPRARQELTNRTEKLDQSWRIAPVLAIKEADFPGCMQFSRFVWESSFSKLTGCYLKRLGFKEEKFVRTDNEALHYDSAIWKTDLDYDGRPETFSVYYSRYGHHLTIKTPAREVEFIGKIGANIERIGTLDFNSDGILDVFLEIHPSDTTGRQIVILDGRKIVSGLHEVINCEPPASKAFCDTQIVLARTMKGSIFEPDQYSSYGLSTILQIALFVDWNVKHWELKSDGALEYTTYGPTWQSEHGKYDESYQISKRVRHKIGARVFAASYFNEAQVPISPVYDYLKSSQIAAKYPAN